MLLELLSSLFVVALDFYPSVSKFAAPAAAAKSFQSCLTLCDPIDGCPPGSPVQARTLEWVASSFSNAWKWSHSVVSDSSWPHGLQPTRLLCPWGFPGKSTVVGCHCLLRSLNVPILKYYKMGLLGGSDGKESACSEGDPGSIPGQEDPLEKRM